MDSHRFFISYNSRDVRLARSLSERLRMYGYGAWFNEYNVSHDKQKDFQALVNRGIDDSTHAILLANNIQKRCQAPRYSVGPTTVVEPSVRYYNVPHRKHQNENGETVGSISVPRVQRAPWGQVAHPDMERPLSRCF